eukprot:TRINITY_DN70895_c0_g1_i1.p1 TRINITY_DN70895_c0_g1~~TRINITY_DN70895_c0_g1_i1.p1  ORF type:complete len:415 (+),score=132.49 TRINITY_DN70895_c0_g1_i1:84-1247(+)
MTAQRRVETLARHLVAAAKPGLAAGLPLVVVLDADEVTLEKELLAGVAEVRCLGAKSPADLTPIVERADIIVVWHTIWLTPELLSRCRQARLVVRMGVGYDNVDIAAAAALGIPVCNVPNYGTEEVADTAMGFVLSLTRRLSPLAAAVRRGARIQGPDAIAAEAGEHCRRLRGQTLGVVGFGRIGTATALRAKAFGFNVVFYDPYVADGVDKAAGGVRRLETLAELMQQSDVISINANAIAAGPQCNLRMINAEALRHVKRGAYLVNTARGELVDDAALLDALEDGRLAAAALDVHWHEPFVRGAAESKAGSSSAILGGTRGGRLIDEGRLVCTPHCAWYSVDSRKEMRALAAGTMRRCLLGEPVRNCVNSRLLPSQPRTPVAATAH